FFFFLAEDGIRDFHVTGVQTCALPIFDPDILIIDEALSVGDKAFAEKSLAKMKEFKERGKTMIFVSHSLSQMKQFCDKILWLEFGMVKDFGPTSVIIPKYEEFIKKYQKMSKEE